MFSRKDHSTNGVNIPKEWTGRVTLLLNSLYKKECEANHKKFEAFGQIYDNEILLVLSLTSSDDQSSVPVSCFLSMDIIQKDDPNKKLESLLDMAGIIFDNIFAQKEWNEYETQWIEHMIDNVQFFYKISREDVFLTLEADEILKSDN